MCRMIIRDEEEIRESKEAFDLFNHLFDDTPNDDTLSSMTTDDGPLLTPSEDEEEEMEWEQIMLLPLKHEVLKLYMRDKVSEESLKKASSAVDEVIPMNIMKIENVEIITTLIANRNDHVNTEIKNIHENVEGELSIWCNEEMKVEQNKRRDKARASLKIVINDRITTFNKLIIDEMMPLANANKDLVENPKFVILWKMFHTLNFELNITGSLDDNISVSEE